MNKSVEKIMQVIKQEVDSNGIGPSRIILGGFSQGATLTLLAGLTGSYKLAGLIALSGRLPLKNKFKEVYHFASVVEILSVTNGYTDFRAKSAFYASLLGDRV